MYSNDVFEYERGLEPTLRHVPCIKGPRGDFRCVYAVYHLKDGFSDFLVLSRDDVEGYRKRSPSQKNGLSGPWKTDYDAMAKKTAIRRLAVYLPMQVDENGQMSPSPFNVAASTDDSVISPDNYTGDNTGTLVKADYQVDDDEITSSAVEVPGEYAQAEPVEQTEPAKQRRVRKASAKEEIAEQPVVQDADDSEDYSDPLEAEIAKNFQANKIPFGDDND